MFNHRYFRLQSFHVIGLGHMSHLYRNSFASAILPKNYNQRLKAIHTCNYAESLVNKQKLYKYFMLLKLRVFHLFSLGLEQEMNEYFIADRK
jgi:hypothetical protein